jgi:transposase
MHLAFLKVGPCGTVNGEVNLILMGAESDEKMPKYSEEFKEKIVQKMMPPNAISISQIRRETGVSEPTLHSWRNKVRGKGKAVPADPSNPEQWSGQDKLSVVIETAPLNEQELSEYCRRKGLYVEQVARWKEAAIAGNDSSERLFDAERRDWRKQKAKVRELEKELRRKEKALAEAAALLMLKKKVQVIWADRGEE